MKKYIIEYIMREDKNEIVIIRVISNPIRLNNSLILILSLETN